MRSGHRLRSKDRVFWTIRCKICGTDRISRSGGTFLHLTPRSTLYCGYVSFHPHPLCSNPSSQIPFIRGAANGDGGGPHPVPIRLQPVPACTEGESDIPSLFPSFVCWQWSPKDGGCSSSSQLGTAPQHRPSNTTGHSYLRKCNMFANASPYTITFRCSFYWNLLIGTT
jgi:hypothetical protein